MKKMIAAHLLAVSLFALSNSTVAATPVQVSACTVTGMVEGGGLLDGQHFKFDGGGEDITNWLGGFGEGAVAMSCGNFGTQLDAAIHGFGASGNAGAFSFTATDTNSHFGGDVFWRNPAKGAVGFSASRITHSFSSASSFGGTFNASDALWRLGAFGEFYGSDTFSLGGGAYYLTGELPTLVWTQNGFEGDVYANYYPSNNVALRLRGDLLAQTFYNKNVAIVTFGGFAISADAEYLIPDSAFSLFVGGRYANRDRKDTQDSFAENIVDLQGFVGAKFTFGGPTPCSLRQRDRHGTFDNTSVMQEKLPNIWSDQPYN